MIRQYIVESTKTSKYLSSVDTENKIYTFDTKNLREAKRFDTIEQIDNIFKSVWCLRYPLIIITIYVHVEQTNNNDDVVDDLPF